MGNNEPSSTASGPPSPKGKAEKASQIAITIQK